MSGLPKAPSYLLQSFRRTFATRLKRLGIEEAMVAQLMELSVKGETFGRYGAPNRVGTFSCNAIAKLDFGFDLSS